MSEFLLDTPLSGPSDKFIISVVRLDLKDKRGNLVPGGRLAAQASHACVLATNRHIYEQSVTVLGSNSHGAFPDSEKFALLQKLVRDYADVPFTKLLKECRDEKELKHLAMLASTFRLNYSLMWDEDELFYGHNGKVLTAIGIGPAEFPKIDAITNYLPLLTLNR